ncbi:GGDEF domain-containing protein [Mesorhizobium sp. BR1-1-16]|uniref:GGDEF domain-containing protein n=1 Tax=Mesorhizobium sp. BR1-1-16 TaxID=2876653 RepID=UPI001CCA7D63|nr:GGDEF domain-containing protein [Mesorhizobium sp. BR1-1-16]MBZ9938918.1 GGDEF domain-containing protein [Mesorhizobium sp. BR1-1-16]
MGSAAFLLAINFAIGVSFAAAFLALTWRTEVSVGRWCAAGFLAASATVCVQALASTLPSVPLFQMMSFVLFMGALTLITAGLTRHYRPGSSVRPLFGLALLAAVLNVVAILGPVGSVTLRAFAYQTPFAVMLAIAAVITLTCSRRRAVDLGLAIVLAASAIQFLAKAVSIALSDDGPGTDYLNSVYAHYSQTMGGILSLLLGVAITGLVTSAVMAEAARRLQRDALSGTLNRGAFLEQADRALRTSQSGIQSTLIMCDLDHFKSINDRFGHAAGDDVIRTFGTNLAEFAGKDGVCGRIGGEEFCILMTDCSIAAARVYIDAIRELSAMTIYPMLPEDHRVTASFGIALTDRTEAIEDAMRRADLALYEAKAAGRDGYRFAALPLAPTPRSKVS